MTEKKTLRRMQKTIYDYDAIIFDVDGTLYYQTPLRWKMAWKLFVHYLRHPLHCRELFAIKTFRQIREHWNDIPVTKAGPGTVSTENTDRSLDWLQYKRVGKILHMPATQVKTAVEHWMYQVPLALLPGCQDRLLSKLIPDLRRRNITIIVYSDYPADDKLKTMNIRADYVFCALDEQIMCLKPDPRGMRHILASTGLHADQVLMIGDRYQKDGLSARSVHADWLILPARPGKRKKLLKELFHEIG